MEAEAHSVVQTGAGFLLPQQSGLMAISDNLDALSLDCVQSTLHITGVYRSLCLFPYLKCPWLHITHRIKSKILSPGKVLLTSPFTHIPVPSAPFVSSSIWEGDHDGLVKAFLVSECFFLFFSSKDTMDPSKPISNVTSEKFPNILSSVPIGI